jgi:DNA-binding MarR family transcriptional regulator
MDPGRRANGTRSSEARTAAAQAWQLMIEIFQAQRHHFERAAATLELTKQQAHALFVLGDDETCSMSGLAQILACDASSVTGIVDRLEARGLVTRRSNASDRRMRLLVLTPAGARLHQRYRSLVKQAPPAIAQLPEELQTGLRDILLQVAERSRAHA